MRTPGTESNVKEIYDACNVLAADPENVILNQFSEFGNHLVHYLATGSGAASASSSRSRLRPRAFACERSSPRQGQPGRSAPATTSRSSHGSLVVAVEALECPTMLRNGFGAHNIQGIGDKHIPLIHNVMNTDVVLAVSDRATDRLGVLFGTDMGRAYLASRRGVAAELIAELDSLGLSSICNVLGAIKVAKQFGLGPEDLVATVATDGAAMYGSERELTLARHFSGRLRRDGGRQRSSASTCSAQTTDNLLELTVVERERIFNLGYFTWVEQQGVSIEDFETRRAPAFWDRLHASTADVGCPDRRVQRRDRRPGVADDAPLVCAGCGGLVARDPYRRSAARTRLRHDDVDHVLRRWLDSRTRRRSPATTTSATRSCATARSSTPHHVGPSADAEFAALVRELDERIAVVDGHGFSVTPFVRADALSERLGSLPARGRLGEGRDGERLRVAQGQTPVRGAPLPRGL